MQDANNYSAKQIATSPKAREINLLEQLRDMDGYLADAMTSEDFNRMIGNIKNDFPIFMGTEIAETTAKLEAAEETIKLLKTEANGLTSQIESLQDDIETERRHRRELIVALINCDSPDLDDLVILAERVRIKLEEGAELTADEKKYILSRI